MAERQVGVNLPKFDNKIDGMKFAQGRYCLKQVLSFGVSCKLIRFVIEDLYIKLNFCI